MSSDGLRQRIMDKAKEEGASLVGIVRIADLKNAPSYSTYDENPFYPEYKGVEWKDEYKTMLVWGLAHPAAEPVLDWWSLKVRGFTPGNCELAAQSKRLRVWLNEELGMGALSLPYQIEYGGAFLKDAAVLAGLGVFGRDNLLITPEYGPRIRLRGIFMEADLEPTLRLEGFDPCATCSKPCQRVCPRTAFRSGSYQRTLCKQEQDQLDVDFEVLDGEIMGLDEPSEVTKYCRACELACPVGQDGGGGFVSPPDQALPDQPRFVLDDEAWAAFGAQLSGKSAPLPALAEAAATVSPFEGDAATLRLEALEGYRRCRRLHLWRRRPRRVPHPARARRPARRQDPRRRPGCSRGRLLRAQGGDGQPARDDRTPARPGPARRPRDPARAHGGRRAGAGQGHRRGACWYRRCPVACMRPPRCSPGRSSSMREPPRRAASSRSTASSPRPRARSISSSARRTSARA